MKDLLSDGRRKYFSPQEVADYLGISRRTAYDLISRGDLRTGKFGRSVRVPRDEILRYEQDNMLTGRPA
jgi:excisionase family DNA binding protein